jgi:hypothetical protein
MKSFEISVSKCRSFAVSAPFAFFDDTKVQRVASSAKNKKAVLFTKNRLLFYLNI